MDTKRLLYDIRNGKIENLYLLYGREGFLINIILKELENKYIDSLNRNFNYIVLEGENLSIDNLINNCETTPFMGEKKLVIVKESNLFSSNKSKDSQSEEALIKYLNDLSKSTLLIFVEGESIDKRKKIYKEIKKYGYIYEFSRLSRTELIKWIRDYFSKSNISISNNSINHFIDVIGYDDKNSSKTLYDIDNEMKKICNFVGNKLEVTNEDIEIVLNKTLDNNIFALVDAVAEKKGDKGLSILNQLLTLGEPEAKILHMLVRQFKILNFIKIMLEKGYTTMAISPKLSLPNYILKKNVKQSSLFSSHEILNLLNIALETDKKIKTGYMNPRLALEIFIVKCCQQ